MLEVLAKNLDKPPDNNGGPTKNNVNGNNENTDGSNTANPNDKVKAWKKAALMTKTLNAFKDNVSIAPSEAPSEFDTRKIIKYGTTYQAAWGIFSEYCSNSTIHGVRYLGESKRPWLERLFWVFVFAFSIYLCSRLTMNIWDKWTLNPVIVSFAEKSTPVWQIPFPAVTVCPETKARRSVFNFTDVYYKIAYEMGNVTENEEYYMKAISQICDTHLFENFGYGPEHANASSILEALESSKPKFNETYFVCKWRNRLGCSDMFFKVLTEEGICYSFNTLDAEDIYRTEETDHDLFLQYEQQVDNYAIGLKEEGIDVPSELQNITKRNLSTIWNLEDGYGPNAGSEAFPERVLGAGARAGLFLVLNGFKQDYDQICRGPVQGFKILLHTPGEIPQVSKQYFRIPFNQEVLISIKPKIITTSDGLKHYHPQIRQCYFQRERNLAYFKLYTQSNCELECLANYTYSQCGCVKFSMPRNTSIPVCGSQKIDCYNQAEDALLKNEFEQGLKTSKENYRGETDCNCLPACTSIAYEAEISQADYDFVSQFEAYMSSSYLDDHPGTQMARLSIFFKEAQFLTSKRSELYGTTDFLANCGGLLGLFMGVSALSIIELVYFCTVRLITNLKMRSRKMKQLKTITELGIAPAIIISDDK
ncbi:pickpocket protein 28-like [Condylostylus longicornis]|uniref:pickpocket protein 28-like n=1 Tax=Condylostylus longicornis TaxID=2530218 RepID=UPI00244DF350|nr:pickpocket protein 28-like [Condylostylus longicornis]